MATKRLTAEAGNTILAQVGWFQGLNQIIRDYGLTPDEGAKLKVGLFKLLLGKVEEAKGEVNHLRTAVSQMEAACRAGLVANRAQGLQVFDGPVTQVIGASKRFDGWAVSLLESDMSIVAAVQTPATAGKRIDDLKRSFAELWATRIQDGFKMMARHPEFFDVMTTRV